MGIVFAVRGSLTARYSNGGSLATNLAPSDVTVAADAGALSGSSIQFASNNNLKPLLWKGRSNTPNGRIISFNIRKYINYTGSPASRRQFLTLSGLSGRFCIEINHTSAGALEVFVRNESGTVCINSVSAGSWSPTSGTWYDITITWDGTTTANSFKVYIDAVLQGSGITPTAAFTASWTDQYFSEIGFGGGVNNPIINGGKVDEIVIWDEVINPSSVALESGTGSLSGASRNSLVSVAALDGASWSALSADKIKTGESQTQAGVTVNGTYDGSDRWTAPDADDLRSGVQLKNNSTSLNLTGTLVVPSLADTKIGVNGDGGVGTYDGSDRFTSIPENKVESGYSYQDNSLTENKTGTLVTNTAADVKHGVTASDGVGTYRGYDLWTAVPASKIQSGYETLQDGEAVVGTLPALVVDNSVRTLLNKILAFIGAENLTNDEYDTSTLTGSSPAQDVYEFLLGILVAREAVSSMKERLKNYFLAKGVDLSPDLTDEPTFESKVLVGGDLSTAVVEDDKSNLIIGGSL